VRLAIAVANKDHMDGTTEWPTIVTPPPAEKEKKGPTLPDLHARLRDRRPWFCAAYAKNDTDEERGETRKRER
jgi:hypothetical protein